MKKIFAATFNTRPILKNSYRFIRSDVPKFLSPNEVLWLINKNITTVVDLRSKAECLKASCPLEADSRFTYFHMPVTGGNNVPGSADEVISSYINMVDSRMAEIVDTILNSSTNVLYFCNAGKDRTGVVSAILLYKLGFNSEYIIDDYMKSEKNLPDILHSHTTEQNYNIDVITPQRQYITKFLQYITHMPTL